MTVVLVLMLATGPNEFPMSSLDKRQRWAKIWKEKFPDHNPVCRVKV
jgi:hypothetical protein